MSFSRTEPPRPTTAIVPSAGTDTPVLFIGNESIVGIYIPVGWADGDLTFKVGDSTTAANLKPLYKGDGTLYTITVGAIEDCWVAVDPIYFLAHEYAIVVSSVAQAGAASTRTLIVKTRHV